MTDFFNWLLEADISTLNGMLKSGELEVFAAEAYKDGQFIRFELGFAYQEGWYMINPDFKRWGELQSLPLNGDPVRIPFEAMNPEAQKWVEEA